MKQDLAARNGKPPRGRRKRFDDACVPHRRRRKAIQQRLDLIAELIRYGHRTQSGGRRGCSAPPTALDVSRIFRHPKGPAALSFGVHQPHRPCRSGAISSQPDRNAPVPTSRWNTLSQIVATARPTRNRVFTIGRQAEHRRAVILPGMMRRAPRAAGSRAPIALPIPVTSPGLESGVVTLRRDGPEIRGLHLCTRPRPCGT